MSDTNETSADIIAEMRDLGKLDEKSTDKIPRRLMGLGLRTYADRLEAAAKCGGNVAAMREALEAARRTLKLVYENAVGFLQPRLADEIIHTGSTIEAALSAPPRNCDVGTAEEQEDRFFAFCKAHECTMNCHIKKKWSFKCGHKPSCGVLWSQMPYEKGGAK